MPTFDREDWVTIRDAGGTYRGEVYLEMTFYASGPPPLKRRPSKLSPQEKLQPLNGHSRVPTVGEKVAVAGAQAQETSPPKKDRPLQAIQESQEPPPLPSILHPGSKHDQGGLPDEHTAPADRPPPSTSFAGRPPTSPVVQQPSNTNPFRIPGKYSPLSPCTGCGRPRSPHLDYSPPTPSHSPPRQSNLDYNPRVSDPAPGSTPGSEFVLSLRITVDSTPPGPRSYDPSIAGSGYSPPHPAIHMPQLPSQPISSYPGGPCFPSASPQLPSNFPPSQSTSFIYPPPRSDDHPAHPEYPQPESTYPPLAQSEYPDQASSFLPHQSTYPPQPQSTYPMYEHTPPAPGSGLQPFPGGEWSVGESPDPARVQRYSSLSPLLNDVRSSWNSGLTFPVTPTSPPHSSVSVYSPGAEYSEMERKVELAGQWDWS